MRFCMKLAACKMAYGTPDARRCSSTCPCTPLLSRLPGLAPRTDTVTICATPAALAWSMTVVMDSTKPGNGTLLRNSRSPADRWAGTGSGWMKSPCACAAPRAAGVARDRQAVPAVAPFDEGPADGASAAGDHDHDGLLEVESHVPLTWTIH